MGLLLQTWFENNNNRLQYFIRHFDFPAFSKSDFKSVIKDPLKLQLSLLPQIRFENTNNRPQYLIQHQNLKRWLTKTMNFSIHEFDLQFLTR